MALNIQQALVAGRGVVLLGELNADPPTVAELITFVANPATFPTGFAPFGDTHAEDLPETEFEGGDVTFLSTWWTPNADSISEAVSLSTTVNALQFDNETMALYEGGGNQAGDGVFWAPKSPVPTRSSALTVMVDKRNGSVKALYQPQVAIRAADGISHDTEDYSQIPLRFSEEQHPQASGPHAWIGDGFGVQAPVGG